MVRRSCKNLFDSDPNPLFSTWIRVIPQGKLLKLSQTMGSTCQVINRSAAESHWVRAFYLVVLSLTISLSSESSNRSNCCNTTNFYLIDSKG